MFYIPFFLKNNEQEVQKKEKFLVVENLSFDEYDFDKAIKCKSEKKAYKLMFQLQKKTKKLYSVIKSE
jgi:hypothetical protein